MFQHFRVVLSTYKFSFAGPLNTAFRCLLQRNRKPIRFWNLRFFEKGIRIIFKSVPAAIVPRDSKRLLSQIFLFVFGKTALIYAAPFD